MQNIIIVDHLDQWRFDINHVEVVSSKEYLTNDKFSALKQVRLFNLSRSYRYQSIGYYVSLLAEARGHKAFPSIRTIQDLRSQKIIRLVSDDIDELIQKSLKKIKSNSFELGIYFGKNVAKQYERLALQLYNLFQSPLLRAKFIFNKRWILQDISPIALKDVSEAHHDALIQFANQYFEKTHYTRRAKSHAAYDLAILYNPEEQFAPSDARAIKKFMHAASKVGFKPQIISKNDFNKVPFFDALFIRETTAVNHHTYSFAQRAATEGLTVLDDPESIIKCTNKVYLAELFSKNKIPRPRTEILYKENVADVHAKIGFPLVLKLPDGSFSQSVIKVDDEKHLQEVLKGYFSQSELLIAQEFMPTEFDWRIGILNKKPLYACKYYMVKKHWQIYKIGQKKRISTGAFETLPISEVPEVVVKTALKAANLIGEGFYGVDLKQIGNKAFIVEVNDNPSIDQGVEDKFLGQALYDTIMGYFIQKVKERKQSV